jgi:ER lumen protein retaining receptor
VRYLDLFMYFISLYNTFMKIFFISSTAFIIYLMRYKKPFCTVSTQTLLLTNFPNGKLKMGSISIWYNKAMTDVCRRMTR